MSQGPVPPLLEDDEKLLLDEVCTLEEEDEPLLFEVCPLEETPLRDELDLALEELGVPDELLWVVPPPLPVDSPPVPPVPVAPLQLATTGEKRPQTIP